MCKKCEESDQAVAAYIREHECSNASCVVPHDKENFRGTHFWMIAVAFNRCSVVADKMEKSRELVDDPIDLPASILADWEAHAIEALEALRRMRTMKEAADRATKSVSAEISEQG